MKEGMNNHTRLVVSVSSSLSREISEKASRSLSRSASMLSARVFICIIVYVRSRSHTETKRTRVANCFRQ